MKTRILLTLLISATLSSLCSMASAYPEFQIEQHSDGGGLIIATNPDSRPWTCSDYWHVYGEEFGEPRTETRGGNFGVGVGFKNATVLNAGGVALTNIQPFGIPQPACH